MPVRYKVGFTTGAFDLFHIGHLNLLKRAKEYCHYLIVGVNTDAFIREYKKTVPVIPFEERKEIVGSIRYVDLVVPQDTVKEAKLAVWEEHRYQVLITGDDWKGSETWRYVESFTIPLGIDILYLPYTTGISSSLIKRLIEERLGE
jgi:glycerol-3-phosphate cytidylyltransferase